MKPPVARLSLRAKLVLAFAVAPLLVAVPLLRFLQDGVERQSREWFESRSLGVARVVAGSLGAAVDFDDRQSATETLAQLSAVRGAEHALLLGADGRDLATWGSGALPAGWPPRGEAVAYGAGVAHVHVPVATRSGERASLVIGFRLEELEERTGEVRALMIGVLLFLAGLALMVGSATGVLVIRPVEKTTSVARRIAEGDDAARADLDLRRKDELGTLARAFDVMLQRLYQQRQELTQREEAIRTLNAGLEARVAERTAELERANQELSRRLAELRAAQEQLVVADRRVSIGRLAAGVAHEINNPLAYVSSNLTYVAEGLAEAQQALARGGDGATAAARTLTGLVPAISEASQGATRVHQIVRGLKAFSHGDEDVRAPVDVTVALSAAIEMARHEIKHRARLETQLQSVPKVSASEVRLTQVFLNLLVNAAQAIPEGQYERHRIVVSIRRDDQGRVVVEVSDSGHGIAPEVRSRLFEPFFTTKPTGVGSGLGLAISQGIVTSYGGTIEVESAPGRGSTFRVLLPPSALPVRPTPLPSTRAGGPRLRVLVVDDEVAVGKALARLLARDHDVEVVASGREALALLAAGQRFDRILCDLEMPELNGADFQKALTGVAPELVGRLFFMTGGAFTEGGRRIFDQERDRVIEKPVDRERLLALLAGP